MKTILFFGSFVVFIFNAKTIRIPDEAERPINVYIGIYIENLGNYQTKSMTYDADIYLYQSWADKRLSAIVNKTNDNVNNIGDMSQLWKPDLYFSTAKKAEFQSVTVPNFALRVREDGAVSYSTRITLVLSCPLNLRSYPMDTQVCKIHIKSYTHTKRDMIVRWFSNHSIDYNKGIELPEFYITNVTTHYCEGQYHYGFVENEKEGFSMMEGDFSCLELRLTLKRAIGYHLVQSYLPTGLIVVISWVSFWIDRSAVPARISLSFSTLLTLATQGTGLKFDLPAVSYAKAIDYWFGMCMLFVFAALVEFAMVNSMMRRANRLEQLLATMTSPEVKSPISEGQNITEKSDNEQESARLLKKTTLKQLSKRSIAELGAHKRSDHKMMSEAIACMYNPMSHISNGTVVDDSLQDRIKAEMVVMRESLALKSLRIDQWSRALFPLAFLIFITIYWLIYYVQAF